MQTCEYCGHPIRFHIYSNLTQRPMCRVEMGDEFMSGYQYKSEFESTKEKPCGCDRVREVITVNA